MNIAWSFHAEDQQADILRYLAVKLSITDALRWAHQFHDDVQQLATHPQLGQAVHSNVFATPPLLSDRLREIHSGNYRIIYEIVDDTIHILSLTHDSQMVDGANLVWDK